MKDKLLKIFNHYGVFSQLKKFNEEQYELIEAINDYECRFNKIRHIEQEFADVMVLLGQFKFYYNLDDERIKKIMKEKVDRQLDRIDKE